MSRTVVKPLNGLLLLVAVLLAELLLADEVHLLDELQVGHRHGVG